MGAEAPVQPRGSTAADAGKARDAPLMLDAPTLHAQHTRIGRGPRARGRAPAPLDLHPWTGRRPALGQRGQQSERNLDPASRGQAVLGLEDGATVHGGTGQPPPHLHARAVDQPPAAVAGVGHAVRSGGESAGQGGGHEPSGHAGATP